MTTTSLIDASERLADIVKKVTAQSVDQHTSSYKAFEWPNDLPEDAWWISPDLLSVHGTPQQTQLTDQQLKRLSKWECINFFSLNINGERELLQELYKRIHSPEYGLVSEYFHHIAGEENEHMWFFATFCNKYGGKIYPDRILRLPGHAVPPDIELFSLFARILIFEEIVDYFNIRMSRDTAILPLVSKINSVHHQDESRHIIFGREMVRDLHATIKKRYTKQEVDRIADYLKRFIIASMQAVYNPLVYEDAGIAEPFKFRAALLRDEEHGFYNRGFLKRVRNKRYRDCVDRVGRFLVKSEIIPENALEAP